MPNKKVNYRDLPRFTGDGHYNMDLGFNEFIGQIQDWQRMGLDLTPDFQRGHVWTEAQQIAFIEFLIKGGVSPIIRLNHSDWMNFRQPNPTFVVVDGLQRITAIVRFLQDEIKAFGYFFSEYESNLGRGITVRININNLKTRKEVLSWYIELNTGGTVHTDEEIEKVKKLLEAEK